MTGRQFCTLPFTEATWRLGPFLTVIGSNGTGGGTQRPAGDLKQHNSQWQGGVVNNLFASLTVVRHACVLRR